jgi:trk system potassium uptake protein TrkH
METTTPIDAVRIVRVIAGATLLTEGVGALILTLSFLPDMPAHRAAGFGAFHAISAFCNAGFGLWTTNLEPCNTDLPVVLTIAFLIILGGIGFLVLAELAGWLTSRRRRRRPLTLHTRIVLATTGILLLAGTILFALLEWHGALGRLDWPWKLVNAFFQAVTPRTAGFNTVPMAGLAGATVLVLIVLMFIGASPGSTGGGIKTSTAAVILFAIRAFVRGREHVEVGGRTVSSPTVVRAVVLVALSAAVVVVGLFLLLLTQSVPFHSLFFETVSAFGTVGLSIGATSQVDDAGKLVLVAVMYVGRVGPLTLILLLGGGAAVPVRYPEEPVALS